MQIMSQFMQRKKKPKKKKNQKEREKAALNRLIATSRDFPNCMEIVGLNLNNIIGGYNITKRDMVTFKVLISTSKILEAKIIDLPPIASPHKPSPKSGKKNKENNKENNKESDTKNTGDGDSSKTNSDRLVALLIDKAKIRLTLRDVEDKELQEECIKCKTRTTFTTNTEVSNPPDFFLRPLEKQRIAGRLALACEFSKLFFWKTTKGMLSYQLQFDLLLYLNEASPSSASTSDSATSGNASPLLVASARTIFFSVKSKRLIQKELHLRRLSE